MTRIILILCMLISVFGLNAVAQAQVTVTRGGDENPVITIGKSTLYGGATGLLVGLALSLALDEDTGDIMRWSFVGGTFGGLLLGIYHVASRPQPSSAFLQFDDGRLARVALPKPQLSLARSRSLALEVPLIAWSL